MSSCRQPVYSDLVSFAFQKATPYGEQRPLFIDAEDESVFFDACQFRRLVRRLVAGWQACIPCLQAGDCVLVHLGNSILYPAIFFSVVGAGAVYMGSNPRSHELELEHLLQLAEPKLIVTGREALPLVLEVSAARGMLPSQVAVLDEPQVMAHLAGLGLLGRQSAGPTALAEAIAKTGRREIDGQDQNQSQSPHQQAPQPAKAISFADLLCHGETDWAAFDDAAVATSTPAAMFCTSGTGGMPKAAVLSHQTVVSQHLAIQYEVPYRVSRLISLPMFHLFGALWTHMFPLRYGQPLFVLPRFEPDQFLVAVHRHRVTETYLVPAMVHSIRKRSGRDAAAAAAAGDADADADASSLDTATLLSSLRYVGVAGAPIDGGSMRQFARLLHRDARACQLWGMTETGVAFQSRYTDQGSSRTGPDDTAASIGRLLGGYEVRLLRSSSTGGRRDEHGDSQPGELLLRGSGLMQGYRGHNGSDDADGAQGWFRTGDVAYVKNGWYYLVGRTKELIKVRGWQVSPAEIEAVLLGHLRIADAAVIGVKSADGSGELPRAFVVRAKSCCCSCSCSSSNSSSGPNDHELSAKEVYAFARRQLASYKALDGGIVFVEAIPRTASGKIQRFKLAEMNAYRELAAALLVAMCKIRSRDTDRE